MGARDSFQRHKTEFRIRQLSSLHKSISRFAQLSFLATSVMQFLFFRCTAERDLFFRHSAEREMYTLSDTLKNLSVDEVLETLGIHWYNPSKLTRGLMQAYVQCLTLT